MAAIWLDLRSMRERLEMVGGRFGTGKGDTITAQIPFAKVRLRGETAEYSVESELESL